VNDQIIQTLTDLRSYANNKGYEISIAYHEEDSYLMRFANSAISLNTNEHLINIEITAYQGKKRASYQLITDLSKTNEIKEAVDTTAELVTHAQPLNYQPTVPELKETFVDESGFDADLSKISNEERLAYFNRAAENLETDKIRLSGIFSNGTNIVAHINTRSEHYQFFKTSDAQVTVVLSHEEKKWEALAEQSAQKKTDLDSSQVHYDLSFLLDQYHKENAIQISLGNYDIIFGPAATAEMITMMNWIGFNGGLMKRGYSFLDEGKVGQKIFSDKYNLIDDPDKKQTYPFKRDLTGIARTPYPIFEEGIFQGFLWSQDDADEFDAKPTGHTVPHKSLYLAPGGQNVKSLQELVNIPRKVDIIYIPFLHYMNIVNPSKGIITASSRFGTLLLKADGSVLTAFNVRLTQSLLDIFGDKVDWLSQTTVPYNTSQSYGSRNPTAVIVPKFIRVNDLEISHSNPSF
jgi:predicted Zn-dependent protease